jgi:hypothetical protein
MGFVVFSRQKIPYDPELYTRALFTMEILWMNWMKSYMNSCMLLDT